MKKYINEEFPHFLHGADYNPEQWIGYDGIYDEDMRLFKLANCNELTVGIFSWAFLEKKEGEFDFAFLDETIDRIYKNGGRVILATPSGARPRWMAERYPEVLRVNESGERNHYTRRHNHCYSSPVYREKTRQIDELLAQRYGKHPAVYAWHISNEFGGKCYCESCQKAFREYLKKKFKTIENLNGQYWTGFWSHTYSSFDEIEAPSQVSDRILHGLTVDWNRFCTL
ncbi:MAG: beta-galactosidase, partial [Clostridia bacterium]|nr:beta-galactosidase [Clostridia bacterium]